MTVIGSIMILGAALLLPSIAGADDIARYRCEVRPDAGLNSAKVPTWIELDVDFYSGRVTITDERSERRQQKAHSGKIGRDTDKVLSVVWRASADIGYYTKSTILGHRLTVRKADGAARLQSEAIRDKGSISGAGTCRIAQG